MARVAVWLAATVVAGVLVGPANVSTPVVLDGRRVLVAGSRPTVSEVLTTAGRRLRRGRLRALVSHRVDRLARHRGCVLNGGHEVALTHRVHRGTRLHVVDGQDRVEAADRQVVDTPVPNLPVVEHWLIHAGIPGHRSYLIGTRSGEPWRSPAATTWSGQPRDRQRDGAHVRRRPRPTWTPIVLAVLRDKGVKATFCDVGYNVFELPAARAGRAGRRPHPVRPHHGRTWWTSP